MAEAALIGLRFVIFPPTSIPLKLKYLQNHVEALIAVAGTHLV